MREYLLLSIFQDGQDKHDRERLIFNKKSNPVNPVHPEKTDERYSELRVAISDSLLQNMEDASSRT